MPRQYLGLIPARGGSKGIPRKNVREMAGAPLIAHTIEAALDADQLDRTVVSTDDGEIARVARESDADVPFQRPAELATDDAATEPVIEHALTYLAETEDYDPDAVVLLQPTSPLRTSDDVDEAIDRYERENATSLVAVTPDHSNRWRRTEDGAERVTYSDGPTRRQEREPEFVENGAIYVTDTERFLATGDIRIGHTALYEMTEAASVDVDTEFDLWLADQIASQWLDSE